MVFQRIRQQANGTLIFGIGWLVWAVACVFLLQYYGAELHPAITDSAVSNVLVLAGLAILDNIFSHYQPKNVRRWLIVAMPLLLCFIEVYVINCLLGILYLTDTYLPFFNHSIPIRIGMIVLINLFFTYISFMGYRVGEQQELRDRENMMEKLAKEAELYALRQQIQPHFLFNSLNSINSLVISQPQKAREMVQQLSDFLRGTIRKENNQWVSFTEELQYLQLYLDIEKIRFGHRLQVDIKHDENTDTCTLPHLLLQPLIENAIKFGLYGTLEKVVIDVNAYVLNGYLHIKITNPYDPDMQPASGTGFGLDSIKRRLFLLYGRNDLLQCSAEKELFTVFLKIQQTL